ncbi:hypothetical protein PVAG01_04533 [Phlyctema vagabunda]|uniref:Uncharacterized protein n=1 Tax=Phlyctema vagabunda TaxID=108571 RepID=A0ABR4PHI1_9HELO
MSFKYHTILIVGATSGIGFALAEKMINNGCHVIASGRRQDKLDKLRNKHGGQNINTVNFDITDLEGIPAFVNSVTKSYPELDCVILNSGIQRPLDFTKPESIDLSNVNTELTTNYLSHLHLTKEFLPFLQLQSSPTALIYTTSGLALTPILRCGNYCASKAAMHHLILVMREQLKDTNVKVIELLPPAVQTELHDEDKQPDIKNGRSFGMPLDEFTDHAWKGLCEGKSDIPVGEHTIKGYQTFEADRQNAFKGVVEMMKKM